MAKAQTTHIAILPSPGMGHLIPLVEFAKRLVDQHNFTATFVIPSNDSPSKAQKSTLDSLPSSIDSLFLPPVDLSDLPGDSKIETVISWTVARSLSPLRDALKKLVANTKLVGLVVDLFGTDAFDVAREFNVSPYIFFPSTAMTLSLFLYLPKLDEMVSCEYRDLPELVRIPGCIPIHGKELLDPTQDRKNDAYKWLLHHTKRYGLAEGIIVNSFMDLEGGAIKGLQEKEPGKPPVYPVGPLVNVDPSSKADGSSDCLQWLDDHPHGSVLYVSFGSGGTLSSNQIHELALGLEMSEQRFLWVVRSPNDKVANATFFSVDSQKDPFDFLPKGFLERTKDRGLVVPSWAPQAQVLSHGSTGGFLTHCGWNSTLESVFNGVPLIAWPLYAEQKMNAAMLTDFIKVALRPKPNENGLVCGDEIAKAVKGLMECEVGKGVRNRMKDLKEAAAKVLSENGSSTKALSEVANRWRNQASRN
ncbi:hydroquinone glucosyltransferase-like [Durio zibethinus]|uniref:Glycosyltransferase n=1 Tax=Durio zibethinus TaxID=66656 RepID=A0A6P5Y0H9_DURZI|nr:hydroquinone glucosyltransferase-like [Durio zibethinus]